MSLEGGATLISEDALRQTLDKEIARLKPDVQAQQELPLPEGMTGAEVAAEELRVAEQTQMQEQARAGVGEARSILEDDQQPLAARRQQTAKGLRALGDVPRPPRDAGWEQRAKEQGFDTGEFCITLQVNLNLAVRNLSDSFPLLLAN